LVSNAFFVTIITIVLLGFVYALAKDSRVQFDLSANAQNTLDAQTVVKLKQLEETQKPVHITVFSTKAGKRDSAQKKRHVLDLLKNIEKQCSVLSWEFVDFDAERLTAEQLGVKEYGRVVIQREEGRVDIREREMFLRKKTGFVFTGEQELSKAFSQLLMSYTPTIYFMEGHGEPRIQDTSPVGISKFAELLENERFRLQRLSLIQSKENSIPEDASVVAVLAPKEALSSMERQALAEFISTGGSVLFSVDLDTHSFDVFSSLGITVRDGIALDSRSMFPHWDRPIPQLNPHELTRTLIDNNIPVVLAGATSLDIIPQKGIRFSPLLSLTANGWIEKNGNQVFDEGIEQRKDAILAAAMEVDANSSILEKGVRSGRMIVISDVDMIRNELLADIPGNAPFLLNAFVWLLDNDQYQGTGTRIEMKQIAIAKPQLPMLRLLSLVPLPLCTALIGFAVFWSRRGR